MVDNVFEGMFKMFKECIRFFSEINVGIKNINFILFIFFNLIFVVYWGM